MAEEYGQYDPLADLGPLLGAVLDYDMTTASHRAGRLAERLGIGEGVSAEAIAGMLREALQAELAGWRGAAVREALAGAGECRCGITLGAPAEVIPPACPVHGIPCDVCGGIESCTDDCGGRDPAGTVTDLASGEPRTVFRVRDRLLIPELRLDAKGCALLRQVINNEIADLAAARAVSG